MLAAANNYVCLQFMQSTNTAPKHYPANPLVMSNPSTYYEVWIIATNLGVSDETTVAIIQPTIAARVFDTPVGLPVGCNTNYDGTIHKIGAKITETEVPAGYYFNMEF